MPGLSRPARVARKVGARALIRREPVLVALLEEVNGATELLVGGDVAAGVRAPLQLFFQEPRDRQRVYCGNVLAPRGKGLLRHYGGEGARQLRHRAISVAKCSTLPRRNCSSLSSVTSTFAVLGVATLTLGAERRAEAAKSCTFAPEPRERPRWRRQACALMFLEDELLLLSVAHIHNWRLWRWTSVVRPVVQQRPWRDGLRRWGPRSIVPGCPRHIVWGDASMLFEFIIAASSRAYCARRGERAEALRTARRTGLANRRRPPLLWTSSSRDPKPALDRKRLTARVGHEPLSFSRWLAMASQVVLRRWRRRQATIIVLSAETSSNIRIQELRVLTSNLRRRRRRRRWRTCAAPRRDRLGARGRGWNELRNKLTSVRLCFEWLKSGRVPIGGSVSAVVTRSLHTMAMLINQALLDVRLKVGNSQSQLVHLHQLIDEAGVEGTMAADAHGVSLGIRPIDHAINVNVDPELLFGAVANLLHNAFKFTRKGGHILLSTDVLDRRVCINVEDECGGLPPGKSEDLFKAFEQRGLNRSGLGLGLFITRRGIEASGGLLHVRDLPGKGCVFSIDLPLSLAS